MLVSQDITSVATLMVSFFLLLALAGSLANDLSRLIASAVTACVRAEGSWDVIASQLLGLEHLAILVLLKAALIPLATALAGVMVTFAQTRLLVSGELLRPKFSRINPLQGFKRLFSLKSVVDALKGILKITLLLVIIYMSLKSMADTSTAYLYIDVPQAGAQIFHQGTAMAVRVIMAFVVLAAADYLYQWWEFERQMRMSKQEIKEEYKQVEGDPQVKGKIKEAQRQRAQQRMMQSVPKADVVIRNPTHFAVALRYRPDVDSAPIVLAKGQDSLALRIVRVALEHDVAIIENVPLARSLYASTELNQEIPPELYGAVAEVLIHIIKLDQQNQ